MIVFQLIREFRKSCKRQSPYDVDQAFIFYGFPSTMNFAPQIPANNKALKKNTIKTASNTKKKN